MLILGGDAVGDNMHLALVAGIKTVEFLARKLGDSADQISLMDGKTCQPAHIPCHSLRKVLWMGAKGEIMDDDRTLAAVSR